MVAAISSRALSRGVLLSIRRPWVVGCLGLWVVGCAGGSRDPAGESEAAAATTIMDSTSLAPSTGSEGGATTGTDGPEQPTGGPSTGTTGAADSSSSEGVASSTGAEEGTDTGEPCGNGVVEGNEACDEGRETATCDLDCTLAACGDGEHNAMAGEECDDGDLLPLDRCSPVCLATPVRLAVGRTHMCALAGDDTVHCWGGGESGQLGYGSTTNLGDQPGELPTAKVPVGGAVAQLGLGFDHTCAVMSAGGVRCWGRGGSGQLGTGGTHNIGDTPGELPVPDIAVGASVVQVAGGNEHTCAIVEGGAVRCWGGNWYGQLGYGNTAELLAPDGADVPWIVGARQLVAGALHNCALLADDSVHCWGENSYGQLGLGSVTAIGDEPGEGGGGADAGRRSGRPCGAAGVGVCAHLRRARQREGALLGLEHGRAGRVALRRSADRGRAGGDAAAGRRPRRCGGAGGGWLRAYLRAHGGPGGQVLGSADRAWIPGPGRHRQRAGVSAAGSRHRRRGRGDRRAHGVVDLRAADGPVGALLG
jgi:cysteine-rich repeat protein